MEKEQPLPQIETSTLETDTPSEPDPEPPSDIFLPSLSVTLPEAYRMYNHHELVLRGLPEPATHLLKSELQAQPDKVEYCYNLCLATQYGHTGDELISLKLYFALFKSPWMLNQTTRDYLLCGGVPLLRAAQLQVQIASAHENLDQQKPMPGWPEEIALRFLTNLCAAELLRYDRDIEVIYRDPFWMKEEI